MWQTLIWRPNVQESSDGLPLATEIRHLRNEYFPYHRLPDPNEDPDADWWPTLLKLLISWLMRPDVVLCMILFYVTISKPLFRRLRIVFGLGSGMGPGESEVKGRKNTTTSKVTTRSSPASIQIFRLFVTIHNATLAIFSGLCAFQTVAVVVDHYQQYGAWDTYCDPYKTLWHSGLGAWATIFYISKYYEFVDTWILLLKGKPASFLQVYHHAGVVLTMWGAVASQSAWLLFAVTFNATIHTFMYTYFTLKTIFPSWNIAAARYLTAAQITQFFLGIFCSLGVLFFGESCDSASSRFSLACLDIYGCGLILLFRTFAKRKYHDTSSKQR